MTNRHPLSGLCSRRDFLAHQALGIGSVALASLLQSEGRLNAAPHIPRGNPPVDLKPKPTSKPPQAKAMISLFMHGGPSQMDLCDPKPELTKQDGKDFPGEVVYSFINQATKKIMGTPYKFKKHGQCGMDLSELLPNLAEVVDDITLIRSMHTDINGHEPSIWFMNTGIAQPGRPALGSWLTYGLGSESQDLPAYLVLTDPGGLPVDGVRNWSNGFMPAIFQGTVIRPREPRILNIDPPAKLKGTPQEQNLALLNAINKQHLQQHPHESDLEARISSYELAARMQVAARDALDLSQETRETQSMYGIDNPDTMEYGTRCLIARRMVERGVRFVQLFMGGQPWDNHSSIRSELPKVCNRTDKPVAALIKDLKRRGMLDTTLVHWGGEIGRLPVTQGNIKDGGRDHNGQGFSMWLAGGGIKGGYIHGATDEFGHKAILNPVSPNDYQTTLLHLFGLDPQKLIYFHNGQEQRLTNNQGQIVKEILKKA
ncbi:MAG: DUF1501 domain-containing protein [Planctomycetales bacterium]